MILSVFHFHPPSDFMSVLVTGYAHREETTYLCMKSCEYVPVVVNLYGYG